MNEIRVNNGGWWKDPMIDIDVIWESVKRRILPIAIATFVFACGGGMFELAKQTTDCPMYAAEASLYVNGYDKNAEGESYNYLANESLLISDARRVVVSNGVAGEVRRQLGEDIQISSPLWIDEKTDSNITTRFVYINAIASDPGKAVEAADLAVTLAVEQLSGLPTVSSVSIVDDVVLGVRQGYVTDFGKDALEISDDTIASNIIIIKKTIVFGVVGFLAAFVVFVGYDVLSRRIRSVHDAARVLNVPVLNNVGAGDLDSIAESIKLIVKRENFSKMVIVVPTDADNAGSVSDALKEKGLMIEGCFSAVQQGALENINQADCVLLAVRYATACGKEIDAYINLIKLAKKPILGVVYIPRKGMK